MMPGIRSQAPSPWGANLRPCLSLLEACVALRRVSLPPLALLVWKGGISGCGGGVASG